MLCIGLKRTCPIEMVLLTNAVQLIQIIVQNADIILYNIVTRLLLNLPIILSVEIGYNRISTFSCTNFHSYNVIHSK